ncbi:hypothetical protein E2C01_019873 [Portunus trituberculatus]|uniref:Uncharacterized protein n=1 Tax=Portunus trituberculatus TaxID=210409 RepID=A0A5B7E070_PORTR|nr:hypothetical protein [Portunus trituberculatus]
MEGKLANMETPVMKPMSSRAVTHFTPAFLLSRSYTPVILRALVVTLAMRMVTSRTRCEVRVRKRAGMRPVTLMVGRWSSVYIWMPQLLKHKGGH